MGCAGSLQGPGEGQGAGDRAEGRTTGLQHSVGRSPVSDRTVGHTAGVDSLGQALPECHVHTDVWPGAGSTFLQKPFPLSHRPPRGAFLQRHPRRYGQFRFQDRFTSFHQRTFQLLSNRKLVSSLQVEILRAGVPAGVPGKDLGPRCTEGLHEHPACSAPRGWPIPPAAVPRGRWTRAPSPVRH